MLKFAALALGLLAVVTLAKPTLGTRRYANGTIIAPSYKSTSFQIDTTRSDVNGQLHAEKLVPIKKSVKLAPMVIKATSVKVPIDRKVELSAENKERQRIQTACQPEFGNRGQFKSNERAVGMFENSKTENRSNTNANGFTSADSLNNSVNQGSCGFSIQVPF
jgi:hypothetical protein